MEGAATATREAVSAAEEERTTTGGTSASTVACEAGREAIQATRAAGVSPVGTRCNTNTAIQQGRRRAGSASGSRSGASEARRRASDATASRLVGNVRASDHAGEVVEEEEGSARRTECCGLATRTSSWTSCAGVC